MAGLRYINTCRECEHCMREERGTHAYTRPHKHKHAHTNTNTPTQTLTLCQTYVGQTHTNPHNLSLPAKRGPVSRSEHPTAPREAMPWKHSHVPASKQHCCCQPPSLAVVATPTEVFEGPAQLPTSTPPAQGDNPRHSMWPPPICLSQDTAWGAAAATAVALSGDVRLRKRPRILCARAHAGNDPPSHMSPPSKQPRAGIRTFQARALSGRLR
jgi:hypothetical protein